MNVLPPIGSWVFFKKVGVPGVVVGKPYQVAAHYDASESHFAVYLDSKRSDWIRRDNAVPCTWKSMIKWWSSLAVIHWKVVITTLVIVLVVVFVIDYYFCDSRLRSRIRKMLK